MNAMKFATTTAAGFLVLFLLGFVLYGILLADFFAAQVGSATGVMRDPPMIPAIAVGNVLQAALMTAIFGVWGRTVGAGPGFARGAVFGVLLAGGFGFIMFGTTNMSTLTAVVVDIVVSALVYGAAGAAIGIVLARR